MTGSWLSRAATIRFTRDIAEYMIIRLGKRRVFVPVGAWKSFSRLREFSILCDYLNAQPGDRILDVGCGDGYWTRRLANKSGAILSGCDINPESIEMAREFMPVKEYRVTPAEHLPWPDGSFDKVISISALEHFEDDLSALRQMRRVLCEGAILALSVDSFSSPRITQTDRRTHAHRNSVCKFYTEDAIRQLLARAGFEATASRWIGNSRASFHLLFYANLPRTLATILSPIAITLVAIADRLSSNQSSGLILVLRCRAI